MTLDKVEQALADSDEGFLFRWAQFSGLPASLSDSGGASSSFLDLKSRLPKDEACVLLDATTISSAATCVTRKPTPVGFVDLATVLYALIFYDKIVVLKPPEEEWKYWKSAGIPIDVFSVLDPDIKELLSTGISRMVGPDEGEHWHHSAKELHYRLYQDSIKQISRRWRQFLQIPEDQKFSLDLRRYDLWQSSYLEDWSGVPGDTIKMDLQTLILLVRKQVIVSDDTELCDWCSIQTVRTIFYDKLAGWLRIPYISATLRNPMISMIFDQKAKTQELIDQLLSGLIPRSGSQSDKGSYSEELRAPFVLAYILTEINSISQLWPKVEEVRARFKPLRAAIFADRETWEFGKTRYLANRYTKFMDGAFGSDILQKTEDIIVQGSSIAASLPVEAKVVGATLKLLRASIPATDFVKFAARFLRPDLYLVMDLADQAKKVHALQPKVKRLWGCEWRKEDLEWLVYLSRGHMLRSNAVQSL